MMLLSPLAAMLVTATAAKATPPAAKSAPPPAATTAPAVAPAPLTPRPPAQSSVACTFDEYSYCTDKRLAVTLKDTDREVHLPVNTALGDVLVIWLPPGTTIPKCKKAGKENADYCIDVGNPASFHQDIQEIEGARPQFKITIRPVLNDAARAALAQRQKVNPNVMPDDILDGESGNIQFSVDRWTINLDLVVGPAEKAVRQINLTAPQFDKAADELAQRCDAYNAQERRKIAEAWTNMKARAAEEVAAELAYSVLQARRCRFAHWTAFRDQLWVQADSTCQIGNHRFIVFRIRNRAGGGDVFRAGEVAIALDNTKDARHIDANVVFRRERDEHRLGIEDVELAKDDEVTGTVHFEAADLSGTVTLRIAEAGGKGREIELKDIGF